jgi:hypothetical protein
MIQIVLVAIALTLLLGGKVGTFLLVLVILLALGGFR